MIEPRDIFRQFSPQAKKVLTTSQEVAESMGRGIGSEHLLIALSLIPQTATSLILKQYAVTIEQIRLVLSLTNLASRAENGLSADARTVLTVALRLAAELRHDRIEPEHLLLAITSVRDARGYQVIARVGVDPEHLRKQLELLLASSDDLRMILEPTAEFLDHVQTHHPQTEHPHEPEHDGEIDAVDDELHHHHVHTYLDPVPAGTQHQRAAGNSKDTILNFFATDLVALARAGKLDPVIGRRAEINRVTQILVRRTKNNPVLVGEPGVGKTAIVEGLAQTIANKQVPSSLKNRRILRLDLALLVAGTMYRGQFEERLKRVMVEVRDDPKILLFVDELHTIIGAGGAEGTLDASNILKPALARGELRLIGATTSDDYRRSIERDGALERRFQAVRVTAPSVSDTIAILTGLRDRLADHHRVQITPEALAAAATLSDRYLPHRALPDKAIDLVDEAAAGIQLARQAPDPDVTALEGQLKAVVAKKQAALGREAFTAASTLRRQEIDLEAALTAARARTDTDRPTVDAQAISRQLSVWTGIPLEHLTRTVQTTIGDLETRLRRRVIGQTEAIAAVAAAVKRATAGLHRHTRPLGSFLFLGPTGVGKTELARQLAAELFGTPEAFIKLDMSEFMERHTVARLVGAPAGYVGYDDGGRLTDAVRARPYSLVLLDEVEKAHPDFQHLLLQIMEDGVLTDARGRRVSFTQTLLIMTSNLGSQEFGNLQALGFQPQKQTDQTLAEHWEQLVDQVTESVREFFRPEFINRLDAHVIFKPLTPTVIAQITDLHLADLAGDLSQSGYQLRVTPAARRRVSEAGFDPEFGARPIRRTITDWIETPLADLIVRGQAKPGQTVAVVPEGEGVKLIVKKSSGKRARGEFSQQTKETSAE